jgi:3-oxoadipate enol-lactonase
MIPNHTADGPADGEAIVFSSSLGTTMDMWTPQVDALAGRFRIVRYDTRGHGGTPVGDGPFGIDELADDVRDLLDHLGIDRAHLAGISLGGATMLNVAARHPDRTRRLAVLCTAAKIGTPESWEERITAVRSQGMHELADVTMGRWFTDNFRAEHTDVVEALRSRFAGCDPAGYASNCAVLGHMDLSETLASIQAPTLIMYGTEDEVTTVGDARMLAERIADSRVVPLEGAKHLASTEQADTVNRELIEHFES